MKRFFNLSYLSICVFAAVGCSKQADPAPHSSAQIKSAEEQIFSLEDAKENLNFSKNQYLKLIDHVENKRHLELREGCDLASGMICVPRSQEHDGIFLDLPGKWTNGFYPGVMWKLLSAKNDIVWSEGEEQKLLDAALFYQQALFDQSENGSTHDLGFILYDSFGEALDYPSLDGKLREDYLAALEVGRATLATRYRDEVGLIRSWDWIPEMYITTLENNEPVSDRYSLSNAWTYPVIVDNMMNLEFLLASDSVRYHEIAFNHAKHTLINHYFYDESDKQQQYPLAYHVFDYGSKKPGNWQGVGNVSAWARGQGWSFYGYITIAEAMHRAEIDLSNYPDFKAHVGRLYQSLEHLLKDDVVPDWDFFAARENAYEYAENISPETTVFHGLLGVCANRIEQNILPYVGYRPMTLEASMLSNESLQKLEGKLSIYGEKIIQGEKLMPCGTQAYPKTHVKVPKDTSAAALYAAALYRYANFTEDQNEKIKYATLADKIMAKLTHEYRTDRKGKGRESSFDLGFVLSEATGDFGNAGEIDVPIIYGDFYFIEANMRKIQLELAK